MEAGSRLAGIEVSSAEELELHPFEHKGQNLLFHKSSRKVFEKTLLSMGSDTEGLREVGQVATSFDESWLVRNELSRESEGVRSSDWGGNDNDDWLKDPSDEGDAYDEQEEIRGAVDMNQFERTMAEFCDKFCERLGR